MTKKIYNIFLEDNKIGTTELENADPPMGVVFGQIHFVNISSGYDFFKTYCVANNIEIIADFSDEKLIATGHIPNLKVVDQNGIEIIGLQGINVEGMDTDVFQITILDISNPPFEEEFAHHRKAYDEKFK